MSKSLRKLTSRNRFSPIGLFGYAVALAVLATAALPEQAKAQTFTASKSLCLGTPGSNNPKTCPLATIVGSGVPVFYVITATSPPGQPAQQITLNETFPNGFNVGTVSCNDQSGANVPISLTSLPSTYSFSLAGTATVPLTVTCTITGMFSSAAGVLNTTQANSGTLTNGSDAAPVTIGPVNTFVAAAAPLPTDLSVTKSASPTSVGMGTSTPLPATVSYTITIKNNGPSAVDVGSLFVLHDALALFTSSVALQANFVSAMCAPVGSTPVTTCLDGPQTPHSGLVSTAAPQSLLDWGYASGNLGHFAPGDAITVTIQVKISAISGLTCVRALNSDGLNNQAFFTLTNQTTVAGVTTGAAASDVNSANDTTSLVPVSVITGNTIVNPRCGDGQLAVTKTQVSPANPVSWGATVTYDITIRNTSVPPQAITINAGDLTDLVVEGPGTPPFKRTFVSASCFASSPTAICNGFTGVPQPTFNYTMYGQSRQGWSSGNPLVLANPNDFVTIRIAFQYSDPDCETVPNANPKAIYNVASVSYMATPVGGTTPQVLFTQSATWQTDMKPQAPCQFVVTKQLSPNQNVQFGVPLNYSVTFTNNGAARNVGTVMDSARITNQAYATQVPFTWVTETCSWTGNSAAAPSYNGGSGTGIYTSLPPQGVPIFRFTNLHFPQNSTLICPVTITVQRPAFNNPNCSTLPAYFENLGLMDVTNPYNPNVTWPPSSTYGTGASSPPGQNTNWATVDSLLPKCYDVIINKTASVNGVMPAWTWAGTGAPPVNYTITVTNTGSSGTLTGQTPMGGWNGLLVTDVIPSPSGYNYGSNIVGLGPTCAPQCIPLLPPPPSPSPSTAGVSSLPAGQSFNWKLTLQPPFVAGQTINNCANVTPSAPFVGPGTFTGPDWYPNYDPTSPPTNPPKSCAQVPVLTTATLGVIKKVVNETGHLLTFPAMAFGVNVTCQPWPLLSSGNLALTTGPATNLPNGGSVSSPTGFVQNVPTLDTCTATEPGPPAVPVAAVRACGGLAYWDTTVAPAQPMPITTGPNTVTVTNTLRCKPTLSVTKTFVDATGSPIPIQPPTFNVQVTCNPVAIPPTNLQLTPPATATSSSSAQAQGLVQNLPVSPGETCTVSEPVLPAISAVAQRICRNTANWVSSPAYAPSQTIPISATGPNAVTVTNKLVCGTTGTLTVKKTIVYDTINITGQPMGDFQVVVSCTNPTSALTITLTHANNYQASVPNLPVGAQCVVVESLPQNPSVLPAGSQWIATYPAGQQATIQAGNQTVMLQNERVANVVPPGQAQLIMTKNLTIKGATDTNHTMAFQIVASCTDASGLLISGFPMTVSLTPSTTGNYGEGQVTYGSSASLNVPVGSTCTISEPSLPQLSSNLSMCMWAPGSPTYGNQGYGSGGQTGPSVSLGVAQQAYALWVNNTLICPPMIIGKPPGPTTRTCPADTISRGGDCITAIVCRAPMIANPVGNGCVCPTGTVQRGGECEKPQECMPPMVPGPVAGRCVCPQGTVLRGRECVKPTVCIPPAKLNRSGACDCPRDMVAIGNTCVEQKRQPGGIPGLGPRSGSPGGSPGKR